VAKAKKEQMEKIYNKKKDKEDVHLTGVVEAFYANDFAF